MKRIFTATYWEKLADVYDVEHGAQARPRIIIYEKIRIRADSFKELVLKCKRHAFYPDLDDGYVFMPEGVDSTFFGFNQLEDGDSNVLDKPEDADGTCYLCDYTFTFEVTIDPEANLLTEADLEGLKIG